MAAGRAGAMPGEAAVAGIALEDGAPEAEFRIAIGGVAPALVETATFAGDFVYWDGSAMAVGDGSEGSCGVALEGWGGGSGGEIRVLWRPERP